MRYVPLNPEEMKLYSLSLDNKVIRTYEYGKDFVVDGAKREIRAVAGSTLPDRRNHAYYGHIPFDHEQFPLVFDYPDYVVYADYMYEAAPLMRDEELARKYAHIGSSPVRAWMQVFQGKHCRILLFGDSITEGLDCVRGLRYFERLRSWLKECDIEAEIVNRAVGGECSRDGLRRLEKVAQEQSDLTIVAYGMNDQNFHDGVNGIPLEEYECNIRMIAAELKKMTKNIILVAPALSHIEWVHRSPNVDCYADTLARIARDCGYAFADITHFWREVQSYGKTDYSMLANGINHPSAYGHLLYFYVLKALLQGE